MWTPVKERWQINNKGCNVDHCFSESLGISFLYSGFRLYNESVYNEYEYQNKGFANADMGKSSYGFEADFLGINYTKDYGNKTYDVRKSYTIFDAEGYLLFGGGVSLSFNADKFFEYMEK